MTFNASIVKKFRKINKYGLRGTINLLHEYDGIMSSSNVHSVLELQ